jgi:hypothetical protein
MVTPQTEVMTQLTALKLAEQAITYLLTGSPTLDSFNLEEVDAACDLLAGQRRARAKARQGKHPHEKTFNTAIVSLRKVYWRLYGPGTSLWRMGRGGPQRPGLEAAAALLPGIIAQTEAEYNDYWQWFTEAALEEAEAILTGEK